MKVVSLTTLVFVCGTLSARAASHCGALGDPAYYGDSLMATFSNLPGVCTTTTTTTVLTTTVVGATAAPTTKAATTMAPTTVAATPAPTTPPPTPAPTTLAPTTLAPTTVTTTVTTVTATSTNTTTTTTITTVTATSTNTTTTTTTTTVTATSTNTTTTTTITTATTTSTNTTSTTTPSTNTTTTTATTTSTNTTTVTTTTVTETTTNYTTSSTNSTTTTTTTTVTATSTNTTTTTTTTTVTGTTTNTTTTTTTTTTTVTVTTTNVTTTKAPTTTTMAPTTKAPTTTTMAPTTTTKAPTTMAPTTKAPTTMAPTTKAATTTVTGTTGCNTAACAPPLLAPMCGNIAAGESKSCTIPSGSLSSDCLPAKANYACPANNMDTTRQPDFIQEAAVMCKTCSAGTSKYLSISDKDPESGRVWVSLKWGPLMTSGGKFVENDVKLYRIFVVDSKGRIIGNSIGDAQKAPTESTCCISDLYSASVAGQLPTGFDRFMVVPVVVIGGKEVHLPMGLLTDIIVDNDAGVAVKVQGSFKLTVANAAAFKTDPAVKESLRKAIADTIDGVDSDLVRILNVTTVTTRRLRDTAERRLATEVKIDYEIILPEAYSGPPVTAASIPKAALEKNINTRIAENPAISTALKTQFVATVTSVAAPVEDSIGTPRATGGARRNHPLGFFATLIGMASALGMLGFVH